jgi:hypothetical protein
MGLLPGACGDFASGLPNMSGFPGPMLGVERLIPPSGWREKALVFGRVGLMQGRARSLRGAKHFFRVQTLSGPSSSGSPTGEMHVQRAYRLLGPP